jgi:hypothetical protein
VLGNRQSFLLSRKNGTIYACSILCFTQNSAWSQDFYLDLLFYHIHLRCFVVIELKKGEFKPEYAGKMSFYLTAVDGQLKNEADNPTIGLILCQGKGNKIVAEYTLRDIHKPVGVASYQLTKSLLEALKDQLPTIEDLEQQLQTIQETTDNPE